MSRLLFPRLSLILCLLATLTLRLPAWAAPTSLPHVALSSRGGTVTFTPDAGITSLRIQVKTLGGTQLYDSGWVSGNTPLTWQAVDEHGAALPADVYPTHIEARTAAGSTSEDGSLQLVADTPVGAGTPVTAPRDPAPSVQPRANPTPTPQVVRGQGTANRIVLWITDNTIGNSILSQSGSTLSMTGTFAATNTSGGSGVTGTSTSSAPGVLGTSQSGAGVRGNATTGFGLRGVATSGTGMRGESTSGAGVTGFSASTAENAAAIVGTITSNSSGAGAAGVRGINNGTGSNGYGVYGYQAGTGYGIYGESDGDGVHGVSTGEGGSGVAGLSETNVGVFGGSNSGSGVRGDSESGRGVYGTSETGYGVYGESAGVSSTGVYGDGSTYGVYGNGYYGVRGSGDTGVYGDGTSYGVYGVTTSSGYSGYFTGGKGVYITGDLNVQGTLTKRGGSFKIDDPLDPANKYLSHSFVESPDMMNIYNGNVTTDAKGFATVQLPRYFDTLNKDFRYQLTVVGPFARAIVAYKVQNNHFVIRTDAPRVEVSWQVTGVRRDPWANANRIPTEQPKLGAERGRYLYPAGYGKPASLGIAQLANAPRPKAAAPQRVVQSQLHP